jgi:EAL domain-containing protein (putative c-di-GMP-specific phosphodiesterase class I)
MGLVHNVYPDQFEGTIAAKLLEIAAPLGIAMIAEGIETEEALAWVTAHGASYAQGYLLGRPAADPRPAAAGRA